MLYKYWASLVGADKIQFVRRTFEYKDGFEIDLPNSDLTEEEQEDFYDAGSVDYYHDPVRQKEEKKRRWEEITQRAQEEKQYGYVHSEYVHQHGKCIASRQGEYNDETCKIDIFIMF